jgi:D-glycero-alpha-D-manno-heptose-7-phosphate kinase
MIITRTPFRISFFGGGTDYPAWYREHGGSVLSTTINKYCYINCRYLPPFFDMKYLIRYSVREGTKTIQEIRHPSVRACLDYINIEKGIEMVHTSDIPARSGIGSSSSFTVGLLSSLYALKGHMISKRQLARDAIHVEQNIIKENVGSQDQVAVAFGGFNKIEFGGEKDFYVYPVTIENGKLNAFQDHLMLFFTGFSRNASDIAEEQIKNTVNKKYELRTMQEMVDRAIEILNGNINDIKEFGKLLHESWLLKKSLTKLITTSSIDEIYDAARKVGAVGGKLLGAGGGGFMLLFVPPEKQQQVKNKLKDILYVPIRFENLGSQVVLYSTQDFS